MFLKYLPYIYNGFISESIGKAISLKDYEHACKFVLRFNTWLYNNENTEMEIQYVGFGG